MISYTPNQHVCSVGIRPITLVLLLAMVLRVEAQRHTQVHWCDVCEQRGDLPSEEDAPLRVEVAAGQRPDPALGAGT